MSFRRSESSAKSQPQILLVFYHYYFECPLRKPIIHKLSQMIPRAKQLIFLQRYKPIYKTPYLCDEKCYLSSPCMAMQC